MRGDAGPRRLPLSPPRHLSLAVCCILVVAGCTPDPSARRPEAAPSPTEVPAATPPNVLLIVTDDQRADTLPALPAVTRWLGRPGVTFPDAHATTPVCCPARASLMTGEYAHNHGVRTNADARRLDHSTTVQWALREAGYRTAIVGKYLNRWPVRADPPGFDDWATFSPTPTTEGYRGEPFNLDGRVRAPNGYSTDVIARRARGMVGRFEERDDQPWFLYVAPFAPHEPALPAPRHVDAPVPDAPAAHSRFGGVVRARQLRALLAVDELVDGLLRDLRARGELQRTLAVFTSDNGHLWGEHGLIEKAWPYTPATAVPLVLRWDGHVTAGAIDPRVTGLIDVAPTILQAAGLDASGTDGRSLLDPRTRLLLEHWRGRRSAVPSWGSIRTRRFQYVEYGSGGPPSQLFDLRRDPGQERNLLSEGAPVPPAARRLATALEEARSCSGTSGPDACP